MTSCCCFWRSGN